MSNTVKAAREALYRFCEGKQRMCVHAQPDDDDMILSYALDKLELMIQNELELNRKIGYLEHRARTISENHINLFIGYIDIMDTYLPEWRTFAEVEINKLKEILSE